MKRVAVTSEYHFTADAGEVFTDASYPYAFWNGLRAHFDEVIIIARARVAPSTGHTRVVGPGVRVAVVPDFVGLGGTARTLLPLTTTVASAVRAADVVLLRSPGVIATAGYLAATALARPYAAEVVGDPAQSLPAADPALARFAWLGQRLLGRVVRGAVATRFVTDAALQTRYPPAASAFSISVSDVELPDEMFTRPRPPTRPGPTLDIVFVGSLSRPYKGLDTLLAALARTTFPHRATVIGDGVLRPHLEERARAAGLHDRVRFVGALPSGDPVFSMLRAADLFVLPSRTEGMPRAMIEAMAVGIPCLATPVGGVPELLPVAARFPIDGTAELAAAIDELARAPLRRAEMAEGNRARAARFRSEERGRRLAAFYGAVRRAAGP